MIAKMKKVQTVVRQADRERLLDVLRDLGVLHITPINTAQALPEAEIASALENGRRAMQVLSSIEPSGQKPDIPVREVTGEVMTIQRSLAEYDSRLSSLYRQLEQQEMWGDLTLDELEALKQAGVEPCFYIVPRDEAGQVKAELVVMVGQVSGGKSIIAVIDREGEAQLPDSAELIPWPVKDNPTMRAEAAEIDARRKQALERLSQLANLLPEMQSFQVELEENARFSLASNEGLSDEELFAIQGWVPAEQCQKLPAELEAAGIDAAVRAIDPVEGELPPTLVKYPRWAMPIKGLFDMLGTFPGYREIDLSAFFMIAMPIFAAMLAGDAGYGLVFLIVPLFMYRKVEGKLGREGTHLLIIFGVATVIWGILNGNFFGITPETMARAGGFFTSPGSDNVDFDAMRAASGGWATAGKFMISIAPLWRESGESYRELLIQISFLIGASHLAIAHLRQSLAMLPDKRGLAEIGWVVVIVAMLGVIWGMFFGGDALPVPTLGILVGLAVGLVLVIWFGAPSPNPLKRVGIGLASSLLPLIGTFGDTMSYIRLMAVGLASYYIAVAFNSLGATIAGSGTWVAAAPILVFGHLLNMILSAIAIFAHGVRLNMLEFSNNAGVQWSGYPYAPFAKIKT